MFSPITLLKLLGLLVLLVRKRIVRLRTGTQGREAFLPERRLCNGYFIFSAPAALLHVWAPYPFPTPAAPFHTRVLYFSAPAAPSHGRVLIFRRLRRRSMRGSLTFPAPAAPLHARILYFSRSCGAFAWTATFFFTAPAAPLHVKIHHLSGACGAFACMGSSFSCLACQCGKFAQGGRPPRPSSKSPAEVN